jgi:glutathione S-transferase
VPLKLYEHPFALFCQKVLIALYEREIAFEPVIEQADFSRAELAELWPPASIPVLVDSDDDRVVPETSIIIEYLDRFESGQPRLIPTDPDLALEARHWDRFCDGHVAGPVQTIVFEALKPSERRDPEGEAGARGELDTAYAVLDDQLADRPWLAGDEFSIADCAAAPALFYAFVPHPWDEGRHPNLTRYYRELARRPSYARVIEEARPYRELYPLPWPEDVDKYHSGG